MSKRVDLHVGTIDEMGRRFVGAWHRLKNGEKVRETHLTFPDLQALLKALSPKRLELLQAVHKEPASSIKALAIRLRRDYKRVYRRCRNADRFRFAAATGRRRFSAL